MHKDDWSLFRFLGATFGNLELLNKKLVCSELTTGEPSLLSAVEQKRIYVSRSTNAQKKSQLGQFLTPEKIAKFIASLFPAANGICRLLDAGAGIGSLSVAFIERWRAGGLHFKSVELNAFEIDKALHDFLFQSFEKYKDSSNFEVNIRSDDFIYSATESLSSGLFSEPPIYYTHAILNPPYKKINSNSAYRLALRSVGIETVNLYSAFVALAVAQAAPGGQIVAIIPRSFCNGPYYRPFRDFILERTAIRHMHLFESRTKAFKDDEVLQENVIIRLERGGQQGPVTVTTSVDDNFTNLTTHEHPFDRIVFPDDSERFIHIPTSPEKSAIELLPAVRYTLADLGIKVSRGGLPLERATTRHARRGHGAADLPRTSERYRDDVAGAGLEEAERDPAQRGDRKVALSQWLLLRSAPLLIEGTEAACGGKRGRTFGIWRPYRIGIRESHQPLSHEQAWFT